jgi:hypothetical protein
MNGEVERGIERFGGVLEGRPRPTPGCSAIEEEEEEEEEEPLSKGMVIDGREWCSRPERQSSRVG